MIDTTKITGLEAIAQDYESIVSRILANDTICKLLNYDSEDAIQKTSLTSQEKAMLFEKGRIRIKPDLFFENEGTYLVLNFNSFYPSNNPEFMEVVFTIDIITHLNLWTVSNKMNRTAMRVFSLASELKKVIDGGRFSGIGVANFIGGETMIVGSDTSFAGASMRFEFMNDK